MSLQEVTQPLYMLFQTTGYLYILELSPNSEGTISKLIESLSMWDQLLINCQKIGLARNTSEPAHLSEIIISYGWHLIYEWCISGGTFDLYHQSRYSLEDILDIPPQYRREVFQET